MKYPWQDITIGSYVDENQAAINFDKYKTLACSLVTSNNRYIYIRPPLSSQAQLKKNKIVEATVALVQKGNWTATHTLRFTLLSAKFSPDTLTWNTKPGVRTETAAWIEYVITGVTDGRRFTFDLATILEAINENGWTYYGIRIQSSSTSATASFYSEKEPIKTPRIRYDIELAPTAPTNLSPSSARSATKPHFSAIIEENKIVESQHIKVATDAAFTNVIRDNTIAGLSLKRISYSPGAEFTALASNTTYYFRCRYKTANGLWSPWGAITEFSIKTKPTTTLTSPATSTTNDITPTITWTYAAGEGGAQKRYRIILSRYSYRWGKYLEPSYNRKTGRWSNGYEIQALSTDLTYTVPDKILKSGNKYLLQLRLWDTVERDFHHSDLPYKEHTQEFSINTDSATAPIANLVATQNSSDGVFSGAPPFVTLTWTRSSAPDRFIVVKRVEDSYPKQRTHTWRIIANDIATNFIKKYGTGYEFIDWYAQPNEENVYKVFAKVGNKPSQQATQNPFFRKDTDDWTLDVSGGAAATWYVDGEDGCIAEKFGRIEITAAGAAYSDIVLKQTFVSVSAGQNIRIKFRGRSMEGNRNIKISLEKSDGTVVYGSDIFEIPLGSWIKKSYEWTVSDAVTVRIRCQVGSTTSDVDIDYFYAEISDATARITPASFCHWIIPEEKRNLRVAVLSESSDTELSQKLSQVQLYDNFVVKRLSKTSKIMGISGIISEDEGNYLRRLQQIEDEALDCRIISPIEDTFLAQISDVKYSLIFAPGKKLYAVSCTAHQVEDDR